MTCICVWVKFSCFKIKFSHWCLLNMYLQIISWIGDVKILRRLISLAYLHSFWSNASLV
jgi:hypothetical protein